jgi:hypothetical protein
MKTFNQINRTSQDRRGWQLGVVALTAPLLLVAGFTIKMSAGLFCDPAALVGHAATLLIAGYCVLFPLLMGYLFGHQVVIKNLQRRITEEEYLVLQLQQDIRTKLLQTLPGFENARNRLAAEVGRASRAKQPTAPITITDVVKAAREEFLSVYGPMGAGGKRSLRRPEMVA